jgi:hypothetical protein
VAGLLIPCLAVLIAKTAGLAGAFAPDQRARTSEPPPAEYGPLPTAHAWLLNRREAVARLGVSPGSNNFGGEPWDNPVYLHDPAEFDRMSGDPCNAPLNWRRDLGCPGENLLAKAEVRDGSLQSGGGIAPPVRPTVALIRRGVLAETPIITRRVSEANSGRPASLMRRVMIGVQVSGRGLSCATMTLATCSQIDLECQPRMRLLVCPMPRPG